MAVATLNLRRANVRTPSGDYPNAAVAIVAGVLTVNSSQGQQLAQAAVASSSRQRKTYTLTMESGEVWTVEKIGGCGCGR